MCTRAAISLLLLAWTTSVLANQPEQAGDTIPPDSDSYKFSQQVQRVAVIGAGATGLLQASILLEHGFSVRLFERAKQPGGTWLYNDKPPVAASFP